MKKLCLVFCLCLLASAGQAQSCTDMLRLGHELMQQQKLNDASGKLFNSGFSLTPASQGVVQAKSAVADIRLASRVRNSQQMDTVRMELKTSAGSGSISTELRQLGYQFVETRSGASVYQNGPIKVAIFNPYQYKSYKVGFFFARDKDAPVSAVTSGDVETITVNGVSFKMIRVQGGTFTMGATPEQGSDAFDDEKPAHQVTLSTFSIGQTEVTQELWQAVMGSNPSNFKGAKRPVEMVSWEDCQNFIRELNSLTGRRFRLPTEAEWEYAARGGNKGNGHKYAGSSAIDNVAWYYGNSGSQTHDVATKRANELGLYDMSGNVYEWCQDWDDSYSSSSQTNPTGASSGSYRVDRGGCWGHSAGNCRVSHRGYFTSSYRFNFLGLRLAF